MRQNKTHISLTVSFFCSISFFLSIYFHIGFVLIQQFDQFDNSFPNEKEGNLIYNCNHLFHFVCLTLLVLPVENVYSWDSPCRISILFPCYIRFYCLLLSISKSVLLLIILHKKYVYLN